MKINLHIDGLILDGLPIGHGQELLVKAAVEAQLALLLAADGLNPDLQSGRAMPSVKAQSFELMNDSKPGQVGHLIAQAVYRGIGK